MDGVFAQQLFERHTGRRDGPGQDHSDHIADCFPYGEQEDEWTLPYYRSSLVSLLFLRCVPIFCPKIQFLTI